MEAVDVRKVVDLVPALLDVPYSRIRTAYGTEAEGLLKETPD
jgi:hypothetical protein